MSLILFKFTVLALVLMAGNCSKFKSKQLRHKLLEADRPTTIYLSDLSEPDYIEDVLDKILIPRVVGTPNHKKVFDYIKGELESLDWAIEIDEFEDNTPLGHKVFKNIIATLNPRADRFLVLACHYDSKYFEDITFVGATDSAVPCAMMLSLARSLDPHLKKMDNNDIALKLIFFDGEEAFVKWGPSDSIYGAKHLAQVYSKSSIQHKNTNEVISDLDRIDLFILLDLIGHKGTRFLSVFDNTQKWYLRMANIEDNLKKLHLLNQPHHPYFTKKKYLGYLEDDHIPFLQGDVPILHLISLPFPNEWHTENDNRDIIDMNTVEDINKILRIFVVEYLRMLVPIHHKK